MIITSINTSITHDIGNNINVDLTLICDKKEYFDLYQMLAHHSKSISSTNIKFANFAEHTITEDIIIKNQNNEEFLLSLLEENVGVIADNDTISFRDFAKIELRDFYNKYKLLVDA